MDKTKREYFIRMIERECKNYYKTNSEKAKGRYEIVKNVCLDLDILTKSHIQELENHMREQHSKR